MKIRVILNLIYIAGLGSVNGKEDIARDGTRYYSFLGIPYLEPPLADLR